MVRPLPPESFDDAPSSWAALPADVARPDTGQMPLFDASAAPVAPAPEPAPTRHARLRGRLQALLARAAAVAVATPRASSWPDSFFDVDDQP